MKQKNRILGICYAAVLSFFMMNTSIYASTVEAEAESTDYGERFQSILETIVDKYLDTDEISEQELYEAAMEGMFDTLDQYSDFIPTEDSENYTNSLNNTYVGIGVQLVQEGDYVVVTRVFLDGPAEKAGLIVHDKIVGVNGQSIIGYTPKQAAGLILGDEGTDVTITIDRNGYEFDVTITRGVVVINAVDPYDIMEVAPDMAPEVAERIGYFRIESFTGNVAEELEPVLEALKAEGKTHLLIDMRDNGGGYVNSAVDVCDLLLPQGPVLRFVNNEGREIIYTSENPSPDFEIVALVNDNSASATEFVSKAIQESGQGVLVGETTYGKGVAQYLYELEDGSIIKLTQEEFFSGDGEVIHEVGVTPDIRVYVPDYLAVQTRFYQGDTDLQVGVAEEILNYLGYDVPYPDSLFDHGTVEALMAFQADQGLYSYGGLDLTTQQSLNQALMTSVRQVDIQLETAIDTIEAMVIEAE